MVFPRLASLHIGGWLLLIRMAWKMKATIHIEYVDDRQQQQHPRINVFLGDQNSRCLSTQSKRTTGEAYTRRWRDCAILERCKVYAACTNCTICACWALGSGNTFLTDSCVWSARAIHPRYVFILRSSVRRCHPNVDRLCQNAQLHIMNSTSVTGCRCSSGHSNACWVVIGVAHTYNKKKRSRSADPMSDWVFVDLYGRGWHFQSRNVQNYCNPTNSIPCEFNSV